MVVAAKGKAKTKTVDKVVLVDDSQVHKSSGNQIKFHRSRGPVALCSADENFPLDSSARFIDASQRLLLFYHSFTAEAQRNAELRRENLSVIDLKEELA